MNIVNESSVSIIDNNNKKADFDGTFEAFVVEKGEREIQGEKEQAVKRTLRSSFRKVCIICHCLIPPVFQYECTVYVRTYVRIRMSSINNYYKCYTNIWISYRLLANYKRCQAYRHFLTLLYFTSINH